MANVKITKDGSTSTVQVTDKEQNLLDLAQENGIQIDNACGGNGVCTTCMVQVQSGGENLSPVTDAEEMMGMDDGETRLACQTCVTGEGDVEVEAAF